MASENVYRIVRQYNKEPLSEADMRRLCEIAEDCCKVKNYVYQRYGGIRSLTKLYPGYTIQNEMTKSGFRAELGLPSVYFYLAVFDALGDIKTQWTKIKNEIKKRISSHEQFTHQEKHYLRFVLKIEQCFHSVLLGQEPELSGETRMRYEELADRVDNEKLNQYLRRQVRKKLGKLHTNRGDGFGASEKAYRYGDHGIYLSSKEKRKRIFIPLTDSNAYRSQIYVRLFPEERGVELQVPLEVSVRRRKDCSKEIGLSAGMWQMLTTDEGKVYGEKFGEYRQELADHIREGNSTYHREKSNNPGRKKYKNQKMRLNARLHTYINQEINRLLECEKPGRIYLPKMPPSLTKGANKKINYAVTMWQRGYVRDRLRQKCLEQGIGLTEVMGNRISRECSHCGEEGILLKERFQCPQCGYQEDKKVNAARNAKKRGASGAWTAR